MKHLWQIALLLMTVPMPSLAQSQGEEVKLEIGQPLSSNDERYGKQCLSSTEDATEVSFVQLIATPEKFEGKPVSVIGYYHSGGPPFHGYSGLFLHKEDFEQRNIDNSLWVSRPSGSNIKNGYVIVTGIFSQRVNGDMQSWASGICHVTTLDRWKPSKSLYGKD